MADDQTARDWTADELAFIVGDYFLMLQADLAGTPYSKTEHRRDLLELVKRSEGSIEFKHQNISAVLQELGLPWIKGYKPRSNYQAALFAAIEHQLANRPELLEIPSATPPAPMQLDGLFVAPPDRGERPATSRELARLVRKFDPAARDARNRTLVPVWSPKSGYLSSGWFPACRCVDAKNIRAQRSPCALI